MPIIGSQNRKEIRQSILYNVATDHLIASTATADGTTATLIDTYGLVKGDTDEYKGWQLQINSTVTSGAAVGSKAWVTGYNASTKTLTFSPVFAAAVKSTQEYELVKPPYIFESVNSKINDAINSAMDDCLQDKIDTTLWTEKDTKEYVIPTGFVGIHCVEYCSDTEGVYDGDDEWTAGTSVTQSLDYEVERRGNSCNKFVVGAASTAGALLSYKNITSSDLSSYDTVELWIKSTIAVTAGDLTFVMDDTAACASPIETLSLPALTADKWTRCTMSLDYPYLDTDIISIGIQQKTAIDLGAFTFWVDFVLVYKSANREFKVLPVEYWDVVGGSTAYLKISPMGLMVTGYDSSLRLSGYDKPDTLSDDTTDCEVDPDYIVNKVSGQMLIQDSTRSSESQYYLAQASDKLKSAVTPTFGHTRWVV